MQNVRDIMTTNLRKMHRDTYVTEVARIFSKHNISGAPLIDGAGRLAGFVSKSDVTRFDATGEDPAYAKVHEIASPNIITIDPDASLAEAAQKMLDEQVHHLVVMEGKALLGMLSTLDFVKLVASKPNGDSNIPAD